MAQNVNQFAQSPVLGDPDLEFQGSVVSVQVSTNQVTALVAGQIVTVENTVGALPNVIALAAAGSAVNGVILRNLKDQSFPALSRAEMAMHGSVVYMNSAGAISRFASVEGVFGTPGNVASSGGINPVLGIAFDKATAANQLIRVMVLVPTAASAATVRNSSITATLAQINAGLVLIPGVAGKIITVTNFTERVNGNFATGTSVALQSDATAVVIETTAEAGLTTGAVLVPGSANVTLGAGFASALPAGEGVKVVNNGSAQTGGTNIAFDISYTVA